MVEIKKFIILPDKSRRPFFDGMETQSASFTFICALCGTLNVVDLWLFLDESKKWLQDIGVEEAQKVRKILQRPISSGFFMSHEGGYPYLNICYCHHCREKYLLYVGFYEFQPARYFATLQGVYKLTT